MREVGGPAREAHENRFNSLSESAEKVFALGEKTVNQRKHKLVVNM